MSKQSTAKVKAAGAFVAVAAFLLAYLFASWAIDSGSWLLYALTILVAAFGLKIAIETVKYGKE